MPLPPAPTKRAALLPAQAYDAPARSSHKAARKSEAPGADTPLAERPRLAEDDDFDARPGGEAAHPVALLDDTEATDKPARRKAALLEAEPAPRKKARSTGPRKLLVLDTNVLMHDPMCLFRFEEHDIYLPMIVLEELDGHKKGTTEVARNARQASRSLDQLAGAQGADIAAGLKLASTGHGEAG